MRRVIVCDLDGPILDTMQRHFSCYECILKELGVVPLARDEYWRLKRRGRTSRDLLSLSGADTYYDVFHRLWLSRIESPQFLCLDELRPGVTEVLDRWKNQEAKAVLITLRENEAGARGQLRRFGIDAYFHEIVVLKHEYGADGKARAARGATAGCDPGAIVWIGDTEVDFDAARQLGCTVYLVECGIRDRAFLAALNPDGVYASLSDIDL